MKALVIGGAGATGVVIVRELLARGFDVTILHRGIHRADVPEHVERIHADPHWREPLFEALEGRQFDLAVAVYGRLRFVAEALVGKVQRLVSIGGALPVYKGWMRITDKNPWDSLERTAIGLEENDPLARTDGVDPFSLQVRDSEDVVMQLHRKGEFVATHFRYPIVYGPRHIAPPEWGIIRRVRDGRRQIIAPGGGATLLSRGFADNIVHGLMLAIEKPEVSAGEIYNICDEELLSTAEWLDKVCALLGHELEPVDIPFSMIPEGFRAAPTGLLFRYHRVMDIGKVKEQLGYRDLVPVDEALERTVNWYLENPLPPGGEVESNSGDPFDYAYEDRLISAYENHAEQIRLELATLEPRTVTWRHPYPHPKKRGDLR